MSSLQVLTCLSQVYPTDPLAISGSQNRTKSTNLMSYGAVDQRILRLEIGKGSVGQLQQSSHLNNAGHHLSFPGYPWFRLRPEGAAEAAPEALQPSDPRGRQPDPEPLEVLRRRQKLHLQGHLEDTHQGARPDHKQRLERGNGCKKKETKLQKKYTKKR